MNLRRRRTARPSEVRDRALKPCTRARRRFLGWYVLLGILRTHSRLRIICLRFILSQGNSSASSELQAFLCRNLPRPLRTNCSPATMFQFRLENQIMEISAAIPSSLRYGSRRHTKRLNHQETSAIMDWFFYIPGEEPGMLSSRSGGMVDAPVSKTGGSNPVSVRVRPSAPLLNWHKPRIRSKYKNRPEKGRLSC